MVELFWISIGVIVFVYAGYPLCLWGVGFLRPRTVSKREETPRVSILISAYNEEKHIGETIKNKLACNYPASNLEILVASDGSTDRTEKIVHSFQSKGVKLIVQNPRQGKTAALNQMVQQASGDILVFSDANSLYHPDALKKLARNFNDPKVGYVTGKMVYVDEKGSVIGKGCSAYMRYENLLRALETKVGSVIGVDGGVDAVRKSLYEPMSADMLPDFVLPLRVIKKGYRVIYEEEALLMENTLSDDDSEWRMRVRVILRSFHAIWTMNSLLNPFKHFGAAVQLTVHKLLRYWAGFFQIIAFLTNMVLVTESHVYLIVFLMQVLFYVGAFAGFVLGPMVQKIGLIKYAFYFCLLNGASLLAFWKFIRGEKQITWVPRKG